MAQPDSPVIKRTACGHPDCNACAREFFRWRKTREAQMGMNMRGSSGQTFTEAALTSNRPVRPSIGAQVRVLDFAYEHDAIVIHNAGGIGGDGRHWVQVAVTTSLSQEPWKVHVEARSLKEIT